MAWYLKIFPSYRNESINKITLEFNGAGIRAYEDLKAENQRLRQELALLKNNNQF